MHTHPQLILASGSRFRRQMLENAGLSFRVVPATVDEAAARAEMAQRPQPPAPAGVAMELAALKALEVSSRHPEALVIGSDQVLALAGEIFAKPSDPEVARRQIAALAGRTHTLPTAVALAHAGRVVWQHGQAASLTMRPLSAAAIDRYLAKAGASVTETVGGYALERLGVQLFERIEGDYFTIIGLPLLSLLAALRERGIESW
jgi:septum formation protein